MVRRQSCGSHGPSFNPIHTAALKLRLQNFKSSFLCVLCLFAAISGFSLPFAPLRLCVRFFFVFFVSFVIFCESRSVRRDTSRLGFYRMETDRTGFRNILLTLDLSDRPDEASCRQRMLELLDTRADCFRRDAFPAHFTGSALVVSADGSQALLHHHRKLDRWLQFGGHCDGEENVLAVARREALEESGIDGLVVASARPFDLDIHEIPAHGNEPGHFHYDVRYVLIAPETATVQTSAESKELRWFTYSHLQDWDLDPGLRRLVKKWNALATKRAQHG
jgi:8-oxo-dGTP pyrophosphatase MutT (NUDIX family)